MNNKKKTSHVTNDESLSLKSCVWTSYKRREIAEFRRDVGTDWNNKKFWRSASFPWFALCSFLLLISPYVINHYAPEFYERYELAFDIWTWVSCIFFFGHLLWRWWRRAPRRRYEVAVGACFIMGVIWTVKPCYNLLRGTDDPTIDYQLLAMGGVAWVSMFVCHFLWRRVRNRSAAEIQNLRAQVRRNKSKNL